MQNLKTPSTLQAFSFFSNPCWEFCFLVPRFLQLSCSCVCTCIWHFGKQFQCIALESKILWRRQLHEPFSSSFSLVVPGFTWIWTCKTYDLTDHQQTVGIFYLQLLLRDSFHCKLQKQLLPLQVAKKSLNKIRLSADERICWEQKSKASQPCDLLWLAATKTIMLVERQIFL